MIAVNALIVPWSQWRNAVGRRNRSWSGDRRPWRCRGCISSADKGHRCTLFLAAIPSRILGSVSAIFAACNNISEESQGSRVAWSGVRRSRDRSPRLRPRDRGICGVTLTTIESNKRAGAVGTLRTKDPGALVQASRIGEPSHGLGPRNHSGKPSSPRGASRGDHRSTWSSRPTQRLLSATSVPPSPCCLGTVPPRSQRSHTSPTSSFETSRPPPRCFPCSCADAAATGRIRLQRGRDFRPYRPATDVCEGVGPRGAGALRAGCVARTCGR